MGEFSNAESDFRRVITLQPTLGDAYKRHAQVLGALGRVTEAVADLNLAVKYDRNDADAYFQRFGMFSTFDHVLP